MTERLARFSVNYDCNESGNVDAVVNAGSTKGFTVTGINMKWEPHSMSGSTDELPYLATVRYTGSASGGTAGTVFSHTDGDVAAASVRLAPTSLGSSPVNGPQFYPGSAGFTSTGSWFLYGGQYFTPGEIQVAANNSLWIRVTNLISATIFFSENLTP